MTLQISINGKEVVCVKGVWNAASGVNVANQFHDLARLAHHAIDKAFKDLSTVQLSVKQG